MEKQHIMNADNATIDQVYGFIKEMHFHDNCVINIHLKQEDKA